MKNTVKFEFLSLSENEALARSVAAAFIMPLDVPFNVPPVRLTSLGFVRTKNLMRSVKHFNCELVLYAQRKGGRR